MRTLLKTMTTLSVFGLGMLVGTQWSNWTNPVQAQGAAGAADAPSEEITKQLKAAQSALEAAKSALTTEGRYQPATRSLNVSMIMAGGVDALGDLEAGRGIDPETYAALYAGDAIDEVAAELDTDEQGRLTYKGKVIRMYPISRLKAVYQERARFGASESTEPAM